MTAELCTTVLAPVDRSVKSVTSGLAGFHCSSKQPDPVSDGDEGEWSQIAGSTSPPLPSLNTPPRIRSLWTVACVLLTVNPGEPVALASIAVSVDWSKEPGVPAPAPMNDSGVDVDTASEKMPGPIRIVSPLDAWPTAFWIVRHGVAELVPVLLPPLSLPPLAAVATKRVTAACAAVTPKPRQSATVSTAITDLRFLTRSGLRIAAGLS